MSLKSGIYKITNNQNGRFYIGSARRFKERWNGHLYSLKHGKHSNRFLQADFLKCGSEAFLFEILEVVEGDKIKRLETEERYLKQYFDGGKLCYNLCGRAISREGASFKNPEETKRKMSLAHMGNKNMLGKKQSAETIAKRVAKNKGKKRSADFCKRISEVHKGKPKSVEHKRKLSEANKGFKQSKEHTDKRMKTKMQNKEKRVF